MSSTNGTGTSVIHSTVMLIIFSLQYRIAWLCFIKSRCWKQFSVICLEVMLYSAAVWCCHHIERIRGIAAYSLAWWESLWQVCGWGWVNSHVGTSVLSNSAGMTAQVSPGTCSVRLELQVHLETLLSLLLPDPPKGFPVTFDVVCLPRELSLGYCDCHIEIKIHVSCQT